MYLLGGSSVVVIQVIQIIIIIIRGIYDVKWRPSRREHRARLMLGSSSVVVIQVIQVLLDRGQ